MLSWILGHRGAASVAPENTLASFERALKDGADGVELDVTLSSDGVPVVFHDDNLERVTGVPGFVWSKSLLELKRLDAGEWFGDGFKGERIPTLVEALDLAAPRGWVNVEIKCGQDRPPGSRAALVEAVLRTLALSARPEATVVSSFDPWVLRRLRARDARWRTGFLKSARTWSPRARPWARAPGRATLGPLAWISRADWLHVDAALVDHAANLRGRYDDVLVWTVDRVDEMDRLLRRGVRAIITNRPADAVAARARFASSPELVASVA
jgi:glycerophosphoryl diester phosphodiesterase